MAASGWRRRRRAARAATSRRVGGGLGLVASRRPTAMWLYGEGRHTAYSSTASDVPPYISGQQSHLDPACYFPFSPISCGVVASLATVSSELIRRGRWRFAGSLHPANLHFFSSVGTSPLYIECKNCLKHFFFWKECLKHLVSLHVK